MTANNWCVNGGTGRLPQEKPILVSACLAGIPCRYDGQARTVPEIVALVRESKAIPVCPEVLGGLSIPRPPAEIRGEGSGNAEGTGPGSLVLANAARVETEQGVDVTDAYRKGAAETLRIAQDVGVKLVVFKEKSPACGVHTVGDGSFRGRLRPGSGVATALLRQNGIEVINEDEFKATSPLGRSEGEDRPDNTQPGVVRNTGAGLMEGGRVDK